MLSVVKGRRVRAIRQRFKFHESMKVAEKAENHDPLQTTRLNKMGGRKVCMSQADNARVFHISLAEGDTEELVATPAGLNLYRLEESSLFGEVQYHDIIEAETLPDGGLRLVRVAATSGLETVSWILPEGLFNSPVLRGLLAKVLAVGGNWERTFGAVLTLHVPPLEAASIVHDLRNISAGDLCEPHVATSPGTET